MAVVRVTPSGIMDKDTDMAYVSQGNYVDANDIRHRQTDGSTFGGVMSVVGNSLVSTIPDYVTSNKKFRIFLDLTDFYDSAVGSVNFTWKIQENGSPFIGTASNSATFIASLSVFANTVYTTIDGLVAYTTVGTFSFVPTKTVGGVVYAGYFDMEFTGNTVDYKLWVENTVSNAANIFVTQEWVPSAADQSFRVVGSRQLEGYLFVFLASVTKSSGITSLLSEIGVIYSTDNGVTYTYKRLIRSKQLGFSTDRRIEAEVERNGSNVNLYWTDGFNKPRAMYLKYSLITTQDGFLYAVGGRYDLETINDESSFFYKGTSAYFDSVEVLQGGGALTSGNKRYTGRFLTEDFVPTDFIYPTNPLNIYSASFNKASKVEGDVENTITNKSVKITVKNFQSDIYKYFELIALEYVGTTFTSTIIERFRIPSGATQLTVSHTNIGQDNILLSNQELLGITSKYLTAQTIKIFSNRMTMSNLVEQTDYDLSSWASAIQHSVCETYIPGLGIAKNITSDDPSTAFGEYQDPNNVFSKTGYMYNDTYRFGVQVQWKNTGKWSSPYWVDDIRFDNSATNVVGSRRKTFGGTVSGVNTGTETITVNGHNFYNGQPVYFSATTIGGLAANTVYYVLNKTTNTFQLSADFGSSAIINLTSGGTGTILDKKVDTNLTNSDATLAKVYYPRFFDVDLDYLVDTDNSGSGDTYLRDLIVGYRIVRSERIPEVAATGYFFVGSTSISPSPTIWVPDGMSNDRSIIGGAAYTQHLFFWSPDDYFGKTYNYQSTDFIKILAPPDRTNMLQVQGVAEGDSVEYNTVLPVSALEMKGQFADFPGYFVNPMTTTLNFQNFTPSGHVHLEQGEDGEIAGTKYSIGYADTVGLQKTINYRRADVFEMGSVIPAFGAPISSNEFGFYYGQVFRDLGGNKKYPVNKELTQYQTTGHFYILTSGQTGIINAEPVFGGDVFNQKSYTLLRMGSHSNAGPNPRSAATMGSAMGFYSQNTSNLQMLNVLDNDGTFTGPGYQFPQSLDTSFGGTFPAGSWGSGVCYWIEQWPEVSNQQNYNRGYDPIDNSILDTGYDTNLDYNGYLPSRITWSAKKVIESQKDNYRLFKPLDFSDLDLTLGPIVHHDIVDNNFYTWQPYSVQRQYFSEASLFGAREGTDIVVGSGSILGSPGKELTSIGMFKKWSHVKGKSQNGKDTFYWYNDQLQKIVRFGQDGTRVVSDKGMISYLTNNGKYVSNQDYPLTGLGVHGVWNDKYSEAIFTFKYIEEPTTKQFTLVYDELKNGFICFHSYYPNIYLQYKNTFFSPNPSTPKTIYLHDRGSESTYYGTYVTPTITAVMNYDPNVSKNFEALQMVTDQQPFFVDLTTPNHISYLDETEFEEREDLWYSPIKNDSTSTGLNNGNTSRLWGKWLKVKLSLEASVGKQKLINFMVKFRAMSRLYNQ
jgi:hypothetical protein